MTGLWRVCKHTTAISASHHISTLVKTSHLARQQVLSGMKEMMEVHCYIIWLHYLPTADTSLAVKVNLDMADAWSKSLGTNSLQSVLGERVHQEIYLLSVVLFWSFTTVQRLNRYNKYLLKVTWIIQFRTMHIHRYNISATMDNSYCQSLRSQSLNYLIFILGSSSELFYILENEF